MPDFPRTQVIPQVGASARFEVEGRPVATYEFGPAEPKPCLFPLLGPSGRPVTRMGHPGDPITHAHHRSVWIAHQSVNGVNFWEESKGALIVHDHMASYEDGDRAALTAVNRWMDAEGREQMRETRRIAVTPRPERELWVDTECAFEPAESGTVLGQTSFGFLAVRVAKTMSVQFGRGRILSSEGGVNEAQVHWRRARWVDYAGEVAPDTMEGICFLDHPANPRHPTYWHVRDDGWMGAGFCHDQPWDLGATPLRLQYRLYVHRGEGDAARFDGEWQRCAGS